jgi:hypothetical protein
LDEDATSKRLLQALRNRGADVLSASEVDMLARSDEQQLVWALELLILHDSKIREARSMLGIAELCSIAASFPKQPM